MATHNSQGVSPFRIMPADPLAVTASFLPRKDLRIFMCRTNTALKARLFDEAETILRGRDDLLASHGEPSEKLQRLVLGRLKIIRSEMLQRGVLPTVPVRGVPTFYPAPPHLGAWSPQLLCCGQYRSIRVWNLATRDSYVYTLAETISRIESLVLSPKRSILYAGGFEGHIAAIALEPSNLTWPSCPFFFREGQQQRVRALAITSDEKTLFSAGEDKTIQAWDLKCAPSQITPICSIETHTGTRALVISRDGRDLFSAHEDGHIKMWRFEASSIVPICFLRAHANTVTTLAISPRRGLLFSGSSDGTIRGWSLPLSSDAHPIFNIRKNSLVTAIALSPNEQTLFSAWTDAEITASDLAELPSVKTQEIVPPADTPKQILWLAVTADGGALLHGGDGLAVLHKRVMAFVFPLDTFTLASEAHRPTYTPQQLE